jgi:hypothetical protein
MHHSKFPFDSGQLVVTKDGCAYQDVLDSFPEAKSISVVTFNISWWRDDVLDKLKQSNASLRVISNIPGRRKDVEDLGKRRLGKLSIRRYWKRLSPRSLGIRAEVFFCFENHAKIIMTDKIAYVGSANFSDESSGNWEAGVIIRDVAALAKLVKEIDLIQATSIRFYGEELADIIKPLTKARFGIEKVMDEFSWYPTAENRKRFVTRLDKIRTLLREADLAWGYYSERFGPISQWVEYQSLAKIGSLLSEVKGCSAKIEAAEAGDIPADDIATDDDGTISDVGWEGYGEQLERSRDKVILAIRREARRFISQVETACKHIGDSMSRIDNTA